MYKKTCNGKVEVLRAWDNLEDGELTVGELKRGLRNTAGLEDVADADVERVYASIDVNHNRSISQVICHGHVTAL